MNYTSLNFIVFTCIVGLFYFCFPVKKYKWTILLVASYMFYLFVGYKYVVFILFTTVSTYLAALWIDRISKNTKQIIKENKTEWDKEKKKIFKQKRKHQKRLIVSLVLVMNFGILAFLKYYNFLAGSLNEALGGSFSMPTLKLLLPLGISFYTFQSMGYVIDVYREKIDAERNIAKIALFVSFFPQIIQGPISFYDQLAHQLYEPHQFNFKSFKHGCELILWGFFKKLIIADRAVIAINTVIDNYSEYNGTTLTFTILLYALQLYADFSGGIDISRGVAQIFGIHMAENFKRPYFAKSINEYWRRWHITLGAWMKDYVFYPIAMSNLFINTSKKIKTTKFGTTKVGIHIAKVLPTSIASLIVFFLVGVWHGANWKYVFFGLWNGGIIMISILLKPIFDFVVTGFKINVKSWWFQGFQMFRTFLIVLVGYVFDVAPDYASAFQTFKHVFCNQNLLEGIKQIRDLGMYTMDFCLVMIGMLLMFGVSVIQEKSSEITIREELNRRPFIVQWLVVVIGILFVLTFGIYGPGYDPAAFVYMQF